MLKSRNGAYYKLEMVVCLDKIKGRVMKKLVAVLIVLNCTFANAYEYSSDHNTRQYDYRDNQREDWYGDESRRHAPPRYQQNYQQPPIQIYLAPNPNSYSREERHHRHSDDKQYREEHYWRERREELQQQPQMPYNENPFYRDDTHW